MSEFRARSLYYWSKIRYDLKIGDITSASGWLEEAKHLEGTKMYLRLITMTRLFVNRGPRAHDLPQEPEFDETPEDRAASVEAHRKAVEK